jgi:uncharacterized protein YecT (DUF1311 family)
LLKKAKDSSIPNQALNKANKKAYVLYKANTAILRGAQSLWIIVRDMQRNLEGKIRLLKQAL